MGFRKQNSSKGIETFSGSLGIIRHLLVTRIQLGFLMYRLVFCAAVFITGIGLFSNTPAQSVVSAKVATNTVSGRVTTHGKPAPGIVVAMRANEFGPATSPGYRATTDPEGNYRITKVPPGNYQVSVIAPVFVAEDA